MSTEQLKTRRRSDYRFHQEYRTRFLDNDMYHHVNNAAYYYLFDSIVNAYLIQHCALRPATSPQIGLVVHSHCDYMAPVEFPAVLDLALRVNKLGKSSVTYEIGVFEQGQQDVKAVGQFVHVFVDRDTRRPGPEGMAEQTKSGLAYLLLDKASL